MNTKTNAPTTTKKFPIDVPTHTYGSGPGVFKIYFGTKYLIWKGKSMLQSCQVIAESVERYIRLKKDIDTDQIYHVCNHIKRSRVLQATVEVIDSDFYRPGSDVINGFRMLCVEQDCLNKAKNDPNCLNNNSTAYMSGWINNKEVERFVKKYKIQA